jgi:hypothetical protein
MRLYIVLSSLLFLPALVAAPSSPQAAYGHGGHGLHSQTHLNYVGVASCVFEIADLTRDRALSQLELGLALNKYLSHVEQWMTGLTPVNVIAQCDTDHTQTVSWEEVMHPVRCLTIAQVEGLAKWLCSRAQHRDFSFDEYLQTSYNIQAGFAQGTPLKSLFSEAQKNMRDQSRVRQATLARIFQTDRLSSEVSDLLKGITEPVSLIALVWAFPLLVVALLVACI